MSNSSAFLRRDRVTRVITTDGMFRAVIINATATAQAAQSKHQLDAFAGYFLAQGLAAAGAMASFLKGEERISLQFDGDGAVRSLFAESLQLGEVRGYIRLADDAGGRLDSMTGALGRGTLKVSKILYNRYEPVMGIVAMRPESIARTIAGYLAESEQIPSAVAIDVESADDGAVQFAGALIVQSLPGAATDDIRNVEQAIACMPRLSEFAARGAQADDILGAALGRGFEAAATTPVDFFCRCSLDRFKTMLASLGYGEVNSMRKQGQNELVCQYCNERYYLSENDFAELLTMLKAREN